MYGPSDMNSLKSCSEPRGSNASTQNSFTLAFAETHRNATLVSQVFIFEAPFPSFSFHTFVRPRAMQLASGGWCCCT